MQKVKLRERNDDIDGKREETDIHRDIEMPLEKDHADKAKWKEFVLS